LDLKMTMLVRTRRICKWQTCPPVRNSISHQQTNNCLTVHKDLVLGPRWGLTPRQTDWLLQSLHNSDFDFSCQSRMWGSCCHG
jgi:hypothetical protein